MRGTLILILILVDRWQLINWLNFQMGGEDDIIKLMVLNTY